MNIAIIAHIIFSFPVLKNGIIENATIVWPLGKEDTKDRFDLVINGRNIIPGRDLWTTYFNIYANIVTDGTFTR